RAQQKRCQSWLRLATCMQRCNSSAKGPVAPFEIGRWGEQLMTTLSVVRQRVTPLAIAIGAVLSTYAGAAAAMEFELDNGARVNWNTTISIGSSWRADDPDRQLYTMADGALIGKYTGPYIPGTPVAPGNGLAGNQAASSANLNYDKGDRFSTPLKLIS